MRLRILMVADVAPNPDSGAAGAEVQLGNALEALGHDVVQVWRDDLSHRIRHGNLHQLLEQPRAYRTAIRRAIANHGEFDVYHVNQPAGWLAAREHRHLRRNGLFVHRSHGYELNVEASLRPWRRIYPSKSRPAWRRLATTLLRPALVNQCREIEVSAEAHMVGSTSCAGYLAQRGVPPERVHVGPLAPIESYLEAPTARFEESRAKRLLYVGQFAFFKAPQLVAASMNRALTEDSSLSATWICEPSARTQVGELLVAGVRDRVAIRPWMQQRDLMDVYDQHGIFLFPSFFEGFGRAFIEAMARGLCVVASDQGGAHDVIRSGQDGILVAVGDVEGLVQATRHLAAAPAAAARMSAQARATASNYTWARVASEVAAFYEARLLAKRRRTGERR